MYIIFFFFYNADKVAVTFSSFHDVSIHVGQKRREVFYHSISPWDMPTCVFEFTIYNSIYRFSLLAPPSNTMIDLRNSNNYRVLGNKS